jgi:D-3-phosphoglycerate dehydrogenase
MQRILAAGDRFITAERFRAAAQAQMGSEIEVAELEYAWPDEPFGRVGEVDEASGSEEETIEALRGANAILTQLAPLTERVIAASPELRFIGVSRGGPTNVNLDAAREHGVVVCNVPGRNGVATAEMTIGLAMAALRGIPSAQRGLEQSEWHGELYRADRVGTEISGSTVGLLGAGAVGGHVATVFAAMGADVLVYDPYLRPGALDGLVRRVESIEEVFRNSDVVSVHARLTEESRHMVNAQRLALMPRGGVLVNAARGGLVDYDAVANVVRSGQLRGAAFDVFPSEPADFSHPVFELMREGYNVVATPHIAGASVQTAQRAASGVASEMARFFRGEPLQHALVGAGAAK